MKETARGKQQSSTLLLCNTLKRRSNPSLFLLDRGRIESSIPKTPLTKHMYLIKRAEWSGCVGGEYICAQHMKQLI